AMLRTVQRRELAVIVPAEPSVFERGKSAVPGGHRRSGDALRRQALKRRSEIRHANTSRGAERELPAEMRRDRSVLDQRAAGEARKVAVAVQDPEVVRDAANRSGEAGPLRDAAGTIAVAGSRLELKRRVRDEAHVAADAPDRHG